MTEKSASLVNTIGPVLIRIRHRNLFRQDSRHHISDILVAIVKHRNCCRTSHFQLVCHTEGRGSVCSLYCLRRPGYYLLCSGYLLPFFQLWQQRPLRFLLERLLRTGLPARSSPFRTHIFCTWDISENDPWLHSGQFRMQLRAPCAIPESSRGISRHTHLLHTQDYAQLLNRARNCRWMQHFQDRARTLLSCDPWLL